ncbi:hypothetical protein Droror1_Dr00024033 [Drosera rotundifolia]
MLGRRGSKVTMREIEEKESQRAFRDSDRYLPGVYSSTRETSKTTNQSEIVAGPHRAVGPVGPVVVARLALADTGVVESDQTGGSVREPLVAGCVANEGGRKQTGCFEVHPGSWWSGKLRPGIETVRSEAIDFCRRRWAVVDESASSIALVLFALAESVSHVFKSVKTMEGDKIFGCQERGGDKVGHHQRDYCDGSIVQMEVEGITSEPDPGNSVEGAVDEVAYVVSCVGGFGSNAYRYKINGAANINAIKAAVDHGVKGIVYIPIDFGLLYSFSSPNLLAPPPTPLLPPPENLSVVALHLSAAALHFAHCPPFLRRRHLKTSPLPPFTSPLPPENLSAAALHLADSKSAVSSLNPTRRRYSEGGDGEVFRRAEAAALVAARGGI